MTMAPVYQDFISLDGQISKKLIELYGLMQAQNTLWAGTPNYDAEITQEDIDSIPSFASAGLTYQTVADNRFAIATIMDNITNALPAMAEMSRL